MKYKFRAECLLDILDFKKLTYINEWECLFTIETDNNFPDCICTLKTDKSILEIQELFEAMLDSHVMSQTLALENEYTGIRV